jgi:hypothetical protein
MPDIERLTMWFVFPSQAPMICILRKLKEKKKKKSITAISRTIFRAVVPIFID